MVNCHEFQSVDAVVDRVAAIDRDSELYRSVFNEPVFAGGTVPESLREENYWQCFAIYSISLSAAVDAVIDTSGVLCMKTGGGRKSRRFIRYPGSLVGRSRDSPHCSLRINSEFGQCEDPLPVKVYFSEVRLVASKESSLWCGT